MSSGIILWLVSYLLSVLFVTAYAKKVRATRAPFSPAAQLDECQKAYGGKDVTTAKLTGRQKAVLWLFALSFVVMILGFIPWGEFVGYEDARCLRLLLSHHHLAHRRRPRRLVVL